jgi:hypothetical protein
LLTMTYMLTNMVYMMMLWKQLKIIFNMDKLYQKLWDIDEQLDRLVEIRDNIELAQKRLEWMRTQCNSDIYKFIYTASVRRHKVDVQVKAVEYWKRKLERETLAIHKYCKLKFE